MTDLDKLVELLTSWDVPFKVESLVEDFGRCSFLTVGEYDYPYHQDNEKIKGYCGFYTGYSFDINGKFISMGAWE